MGYFFIPCR